MIETRLLRGESPATILSELIRDHGRLRVLLAALRAVLRRPGRKPHPPDLGACLNAHLLRDIGVASWGHDPLL